MDFSHLDALELGLSHERERLALARTDQERALRRIWIAQREREITAERANLGLPTEPDTLSDDELRAALREP